LWDSHMHISEKSDKQLLVNHLMVEAEEQGQGVGSLLLKGTEAEARQRGVQFDTLALGCLGSNHGAINCFEGSGFSKVSQPDATPVYCALTDFVKYVRPAGYRSLGRNYAIKEKDEKDQDEELNPEEQKSEEQKDKEQKEKEKHAQDVREVEEMLQEFDSWFD